MEKLNSNECPLCKGTTWVLNEDDNTYKRCKCYEKERMQRLWKKYGVDPMDIKKLNEYKPIDDIQRIAKDKAIKYITDFEQIKDKRENGFGLFGQPGAGKTHIANAIGAALINKGIEVVYMPYIETMRELKANVMDDECYIKLLSVYQKAKVLIIDELFKDKIKNGNLTGELSTADMKHIYPIINYRYSNHLPTLFSSEALPEMLSDLDEALAGRILESCGINIIIFNKKTQNHRMRKFIK